MGKSDRNNSLIITGVRRSGTTFLGKLMHLVIKDSAYVEEPFNPIRGVRQLPHCWYPYLEANTDLVEELRNILALKNITFKDSIVSPDKTISKIGISRIQVVKEIFKNESKEGLIKRIARVFVKSKHCWSYHRARLNRKKYTIIKDAFLSLSISSILENDNSTVLFIYRDPF